MIRVFPRKNKWTPTDELAFIGDPPLFRPEILPVKVSVTFTWDIPEGKRLARAWGAYYPDVEIGGPAFNDCGGDFVPGRFLKEGVTITSRGCCKKCPWCYVPSREGMVRELPIRDGYIVQDNNLLACKHRHIEAVFEMLKRQKRAVIFSGGIDISLLQPWHRKLFDTIPIKELWFACDSPDSLPLLERASVIMDGIPAYKRRCYVMIGFNRESLLDAEKRLERVFELGFYPFCQLYRGKGEQPYNDQWKALNRKWSRPAAYKSKKAL